ncbi:MAG: Rieske (2Fe-2S) protein [bacterium]|nr:Rieske (2Fe-2S) protein [bacterium]
MSASESPSVPEEKLKRRGVMITLAMAAGLVASYGTAAFYGLRYLFGRQAPARKINVLVAALTDVPEGGSLLREDLAGRKFLLVRRGASVRAFSTTCTHLGCQVHWKPEKKIFFCPCHDGVFDADGNPVSGPPPSPLAQSPVEIRGSSIFVSMPEA